jgi:uncharacterized protein YbjQ (UPF0145 family)
MVKRSPKGSRAIVAHGVERAGRRACARRRSMHAEVMSETHPGVALTTTPSFEGRRIVRYAGIVNGEAILGMHLGRDMLARLRDLVGGRSATYERGLQQARATALDELCGRAKALGANAVVGIDLDYEVIGGMLMVAASGTAVVIE